MFEVSADNGTTLFENFIGSICEPSKNQMGNGFVFVTSSRVKVSGSCLRLLSLSVFLIPGEIRDGNVAGNICRAYERWPAKCGEVNKGI